MFADIFTPTVTGIAIIILAFFVWSLWKITQVIDRHIKDLKSKVSSVSSLEITCEELKSTNENLKSKVSSLQIGAGNIESELILLDLKIDNAIKQITKEWDNALMELLDDDFQDEDD